MLSDMKDQEIIVDSPLPRENMGQAVLPISTIPTASSPTSVPQNVTIEQFPLVFSSSNSLYHSSLQPSSISYLLIYFTYSIGSHFIWQPFFSYLSSYNPFIWF